jgi:transcription initiation factor TFIIE subunit alpha
VAQDTGAGHGDIIVDLQMDNEAARRAKQLEAEEKRQQNALPIWHQRSTVSDSIRGTGDAEPAVLIDHDEEDQFQQVDTTEMDADTQDCKYIRYTIHSMAYRFFSSICIVDYTKYYESLSQAHAQDEDTEQLDDLEADDDEFETVDVNEGNKRSYDDLEEDDYG